MDDELGNEANIVLGSPDTGISKPHPILSHQDKGLRLMASIVFNVILIVILIVQVYSPIIETDSNNDKEELASKNKEIEEKDKQMVLLELEIQNLSNTITVLQSSVSKFQTDLNSEETQRNKLQNDYQNLTEDYDNIQTQMAQVQSNFDDLESEKGLLTTQNEALIELYNELSKDYEFVQDVAIGHLLQQCYDDIREIYEDEWGGFWWNFIGDDEDVILFAARMAEHDLGSLVWTSVNDNYNSLRQPDMTEDMHKAALEKISLVLGYIGIEETDNASIKIEKVLDFVTEWVHYESDKNNEFLSPAETLTTRSGDCDDFAILVSALFELTGLEAGLVFLSSDDNGWHAMSLVHEDNLGGYGYYYFSDLTEYGLASGKWLLIEPQMTIENQNNESWMSLWTGEHFIDIDQHIG